MKKGETSMKNFGRIAKNTDASKEITMKPITRLMWLIAVAVIALAGAQKVQAASGTPMNLAIHVSINASKNLSVDTTSYSFGQLVIASSNVATSSITVTNNSGGL